jgi:tetratricopeptide (TPR) repeat protein
MRGRRIRIWLTAAILGAGALAHAGETSPDEEARHLFAEYLHEGAVFLRQAHAGGWARYEPNLYYIGRAAGRFLAALKLQPASADVYYWSGLTFFDYGDYREAASRAASAVERQADHAGAWHLWGQSLLFLEEWEAAQEKLERALHLYPESHPERALVFFNLGRCYYHGFGPPAAARRFFEKAIEVRERLTGDASFSEARFYIGLALLAQDDPTLAALAVRQFRDVLEARPGDVEAMLRLAIAYRRDGRYAQAETAFLRVLEAEPRHVEAHLHLAHLYLTDLPDLVQARYHAEQFLADSPRAHPWREPILELLQSREAARSAGE